MPRHDDTIAALATPVGTAALAIIRISGSDTERLLGAMLGRAPLPWRPRHVDYRATDGSLLDDVLVTYFAGPRSYTGEDSAEISTHGNPFIVQRILEDLFARGCRPAEAGEFTQRAFLNGRMDLSQAEAVMDVIHARSERALAAANQQLRGALGRRITALMEALIAALARTEAYIDFPDEDLPREDRKWMQGELARLGADLDRLLATSHYGAVLRDGVITVIVGNTNVGKSSLLNRLVGKDRALVSPEPGTTRDFIEERVMVGPHCLRVVDTAGLNPTPGVIERLGIEKTLDQVREADLFLVVLDATQDSPAPPPEVATHLRPENTVVVLNKSDLAPSPTLPTWTQGLPAVAVSALTGAGLAQLVEAVVRLADGFRPQVGDEVIAVSARHARALAEARTALTEARTKLADGGPVELLASDQRAVLTALGEIVGKFDNERMLDALFSTFCIGK